MKPSKAILIVVVIVVVLIIIAWLVSMSDKKKTAAAAAASVNTPVSANTTGRFIAAASNLTDYSEIVNGKPKWLWGGSNNCSGEYTKILTGINAGWCVLTTEFNKSVPPPRSLEQGKQWCCAEVGANGDCKVWEQRPAGSPCANNA